MASCPSPTTRCATLCWKLLAGSAFRSRSFMPDNQLNAQRDREVVITGIGLASCLGTSIDAHWNALTNSGGFRPVVDGDTFAPAMVHPIAPLDLDAQIPKRGDQRQMEAWQRIGVHAAGLALDSAGVKGNAAILSRAGMIVAAGGGERDY